MVCHQEEVVHPATVLIISKRALAILSTIYQNGNRLTQKTTLTIIDAMWLMPAVVIPFLNNKKLKDS